MNEQFITLKTESDDKKAQLLMYSPAPSKTEKSDWKVETTNLFLELYKKYRSLYVKHSAYSIFTLISHKIKESSGVSKSPEECQKKYYNLVRTYKSSQTKANTIKFPFYNEVDEIVTNKLNEMFVDPELENELKEVEKMYGGAIRAVRKEKKATITDEPECSEASTDRKEIWQQRETELVIEIYKKYKDALGKNKTGWNLISDELKSFGYFKDARKCMKKMFNLRRTYKKILMKGKEDKTRFPFMASLKDIFGKSLENIKLEFKEESEDDMVAEEEEIYEYTEDIKDDLNVEWTNDEIQFLLNSYSQVKNSYTYDYNQTQSDFWEVISSLLEESGYNRSSFECEQKFQELITVYQKSAVGGSSSTHFEYFDELEKLLIVPHEEDTEDENESTIEFVGSDLILAEIPEEEGQQQLTMTVDEIVEPQTETNIGEDSAEPENSAITSIWRPSETRQLISLCKQYHDAENKWLIISEVLQKSISDCQNKWKMLVDSGRAVFKGKLEEENAKYYNMLLELFGESLFKDPKGKVKVSTLTEEQVNELIELKHYYSKAYKSMKLDAEVWKQIADDMNLEIEPKILEKNYYEMFKKYMCLKEQNPDNTEKNIKEWNLFEVFEEGLEKEKVFETEIQQNAKIVAAHFNNICKICLNFEQSSFTVVDPGSKLDRKIKNLLCENSEQNFDGNLINLVCQNCEKNIEGYNKFKKIFEETKEILNEVTNSPEEISNDSQTYEITVSDLTRLKRKIKTETEESPAKKICLNATEQFQLEED